MSNSRILSWFQERIPVTGDRLRELTNEPVPNHLKRWWFCLGGTPAYLFVVQIATGILLAFYYEPTTASAHESVRYISEEVAYGWYFRSLHKWAATLMVATVVLHQMRVYFTGGYRKPRELNWMVGMCLLMLTVTVGFTGYSLVYEQLSYWGATVGANIAEAIPFVGGFLKRMLLAGENYGDHTLSRFYVLHAAVFPALMVFLLFIHITLIRLQGITEFVFEDEPKDAPKTFSFFPDHLYTELIMGLVIMVILTTLAICLPAEVGPRADPLTTPEVIKPEWFFYVVFRWLKLFSGSFAILSTGFIVFVMFVWPFIDALLRRICPKVELSVWIGIVAASAIIAFTVWEAAVDH